MKIEYTGEIHLDNWSVNIWLDEHLHNLNSYIFEAMGGFEKFNGTVKVEITPAFPKQELLIITDARNEEMNTDA